MVMRHRLGGTRLAAITVGGVIVCVAALALLLSDGGQSRGERIRASAEPATTTLPPTSQPTPSTVATTAATTTTLQPGQDRLSTASRLSVGALGPVKLGMTLAEASGAARQQIRTDPECNASQQSAYVDGNPYRKEVGQSYSAGLAFGVLDGRIVRMSITTAAFYTAEGIHVGSTEGEVLRAYPGAKQGTSSIANQPILTVANAQGQLMVFYLSRDQRTVINMGTLTSLSAETVYGGC
jgi:hypothetical protein